MRLPLWASSSSALPVISVSDSGRRDFRRVTTAQKASQMILPAKEPMAEGAAQIGDGRPHDEAGVVQRQHRHCLRHHVAVEKRPGLIVGS